MKEPAAMTKFVLLKDGTMLECSVNQLERLNIAILSTTDFEKIQVKLDGRYFKLGEIETDPSKIANAKQQGLPLNVDPVKKPQDFR